MAKSTGGGTAEHVTRSSGIPETSSRTVRELSSAPTIDPTPASSNQSSVPDSRPSSAFQQASDTYNAALLQKRVELVQQMQAALADTGTVAYQSIAAYSHLLDGVWDCCL